MVISVVMKIRVIELSVMFGSLIINAKTTTKKTRNNRVIADKSMVLVEVFRLTPFC